MVALALKAKAEKEAQKAKAEKDAEKAKAEEEAVKEMDGKEENKEETKEKPEPVKAKKDADEVEEKDEAKSGICNCLRVNNLIFNSSNLPYIAKTDKYFDIERKKNDHLEKICANVGLETFFLNLDEAAKILFVKLGFREIYRIFELKM